MNDVQEYMAKTVRISNDEVKAIFEGKEGIGFIPTFFQDEAFRYQADAAKRFLKANPEEEFFSATTVFVFEFDHHFASLAKDLSVHVFVDMQLVFHYDEEDDELSSSYSLSDFHLSNIAFYDENDEDINVRLAESFDVKQGDNTHSVDTVTWYVKYFMPEVNNNIYQYVDSSILQDALSYTEASVKDPISSFNINLDVNPKNAVQVQELLNALMKKKAPTLVN